MKKKIRMKGVYTPGVILFWYGFLNGRFKSACIAQDSNVLNSAYINGKLELFSKYCKERVDKLETDISAVCTEADMLILELNTLPTILKDKVGEGNQMEQSFYQSPKTISEAQARRVITKNIAKREADFLENKKKGQQVLARRVEIIQRLVQIQNRIIMKESNCENELSITSFALKERFCIYGHGVLLRPVFQYYIPKVEYKWAFEQYNANHGELKCRIKNVLEGGES